MLKAAIIGCGAIANVHKRVLEALPEAELVACCDIKPERAKAFAKDSGLHYYDAIEKLLREEKPDVVHLCVPHPLHTPIAKLCAEAGAHVFTEKPPVVSKEQWETLYELKNSGRYIGICFQNRYNQPVEKTKELLASEKLGRVNGARAFLTWCRTSEYYSESDWRGNWTTEGGGVLINQAIHTLDLLVYLLGEVADVKCHMSNHSLQNVIEVEDTTEAYIVFKSGVKALFYATNAYSNSVPVIIEIDTQNAVLRMEGNVLDIMWKDGKRERIENDEQPQFEKDYWGNSHYVCIQDFYRAVIEKRPYRNDIDQVKETMQLMLRMYEPFLNRKIPES